MLLCFELLAQDSERDNVFDAKPKDSFIKNIKFEIKKILNLNLMLSFQI